MSATLVSSNTTIKVNAAVSAAVTVNFNTATLYTAPANGYAIVQAYCTANASVTNVVVGGRRVVTFNALSTPQVGAANATSTLTIYVGPSQAIQAESLGAGFTTIVISGVEFVNTP